MTLHGFDISNNQGYGLNPGNLPGDFIICKATEGLTFNDRFFDQYMVEASNAGKLLGAYHFITVGDDPTAQADHFLEVAAPWLHRAILCLDVERKVTSSDVTTFCTRIHEKTGVWPLIYMSLSFLQQGYATKEIRQRCGIWLASWGKNLPTSQWKDKLTDDVPEGTTVAIWQYTSKYKATGIWNGNLDADTAFMTSAAWTAYAQGTGGTTSKQNPGRKTNDEIATEVIAGKWGNGATRRQKLTAAGYDYNTIQAIVNAKLRPASTRKTNDEIATEVIAGKWGNGATRRQKLTAAGYDYNTIQAIVNRRLK